MWKHTRLSRSAWLRSLAQTAGRHCSAPHIRSSQKQWARADLNREDFASLALWVQIRVAHTDDTDRSLRSRLRCRQKWARADLNHRIPGVPDTETELAVI